MKPKLFLATDHAGLEHKNTLRSHLEEQYSDQYDIIDCGNYVYDEHDDYVPWIRKAAVEVKSDPTKNCAVIFGGSGQGEAIVANKTNGVRAVVVYGSNLEQNREITKLSREHNNANVLSFGARTISPNDVIELTDLWLATDFSGETRHRRRMQQIAALEYRRFWSRFNKLSNH